MEKKFTAKKFIYTILGLIFLVGLVMGIRYLINSNSEKSQLFLTKKGVVQNMDDKVLATGKIVPREEIEIKPNISGIIDKILVKEGDQVVAGQLVATIRIVPVSYTHLDVYKRQVQEKCFQKTAKKNRTL